MTDLQLERALADIFASGPQVAPRASVDRAVATAVRETQRRRRLAFLDQAAWPPRPGSTADPDLRRTLRLVLVIALVAALATTTLLVGTRLLDRLVTPPLPVVPTVPGPTASPPPSHPLIEDLGELTDRQVTGFSAIRLLDGRVLFAGGADNTGGTVTSNRAWIFDPTTNQIIETGSMAERRYQPLLALLTDGRVLVVHGKQVDGLTELVVSAEVFDPETGTFTRSAGRPLTRESGPFNDSVGRAWATPDLDALLDGRALLSGGRVTIGGGRFAELYDPSSDQFQQVDVGCDATRGAQVSLGNGTVLVTCLPPPGETLPLQAAVFDPAMNAFTPVGAPRTLANDTATRLTDGRVLLTGTNAPEDARYLGSVYADQFDPDMGTFQFLPLSTRLETAIPGFDLGGGRVLFIVGTPGLPGLATVRVLDLGTLARRDAEIPGLESPDAAVRLADGRILLASYKLHLRLLDPANLP